MPVVDNIEVITYAQLAIQEHYPKAVFSNYFDEDYNVVENHPRYKIEGECVPADGASLEDFSVIIEFTNDELSEYTLEHVQVGDERFIE